MYKVPTESFAEQIRTLFRTQGYVDAKKTASDRVGRPATIQEQRAVISTVYNVKKSIEKELKKNIVREDDEVFRLEYPLSVDTNGTIEPKENEAKPKTKTAVLVVREVRDDKGTRYELDVVGEFNRGMMKEALKQLMEVFI